MPDSEDEQWSRISAESELRPDSGIVADVPPAQITPLAEDEAIFDPIELNEVPLPEEDEAQPDPVPPIQVVPFRAGPLPEVGPDVIQAAPFDVRPEAAPVIVEEPVEMITDVPVPHPEPVEVVADLPEEMAQSQKTPWWRLMLGSGERRSLLPEAARPQPRPAPAEAPDAPTE